MANPKGHKILAVERPARYVGGEFGAFNKPWDSARLRWALAFPDAYEIAMSNMGHQLIYNILNKMDGVLCDRVYAPWFDMDELWAVESGRRINEFDVLGITIPYELTFTNIVTIFKIGGIEPMAVNRKATDPIVIGGGCGAFNPEPVAEFFDAIVIGDGEEVVKEISAAVLAGKQNGTSKIDIIKNLSKIKGVYLPQDGSSKKVERAVVTDFSMNDLLVPNIQVVHDRVGIEIQRGCTRGCRFCQAGFTYRPVRQREVDDIIASAEGLVSKTGHEECAFLSLSAGDHPQLPDAVRELDARFKSKWVQISLPSLRTESLTDDTIEVLSRSLGGGFTLAPEAATERLRRAINKGNTEEDLLNSVEKIFSAGWRNLKLYFMIGLPSETKEDVYAIADLAKKAISVGRKFHKNPNITINVSTFIPKSHTPLQWERQISLSEIKELHEILRGGIRGHGLKLKMHDARVSFIEGLFARGDRRLAKVILDAWDAGCRFDAWDEHLRFDTWMEVLKKNNIDVDEYLSARDLGKPLPWEHLFSELKREYLIGERKKYFAGAETQDCAFTKCTGCGVCDFEKVKPKVCHPQVHCHSQVRCHPREGGDPLSIGDPRLRGDDMGHRNDKVNEKFTYRLHFTKTANAVFIGHIDLMTTLKRALRRANVPLRYTEGFNPRPKVSFGDALPLGVESLDEFFEIETPEEIDTENAVQNINKCLPDGIRVKSVELVQTGAPAFRSRIASVEFTVGAYLPEDKIRDFYAAEQVIFSKTTHKGMKNVDIKNSVIALEKVSDHMLRVALKVGGASITDVASYFFGKEEARSLKITKEKMCLTN